MRLYYISILAVLLTGCGSDDGGKTDISPSSNSTETSVDGVTVSGTLNGGAGQVVNLQQIDPKNFQWVVVDTDTIGQDNSFELTSPAKTLETYTIAKSNAQSAQDFIFLMMQDGESPEVSAQFNDMMYTYKVEGSPQSEIEHEYRSIQAEFKPVIDSLRKVSADLPFEEKQKRGAILEKIEGLKNEENKARKDFIAKYKSEPGVTNAIMDFINPKRQVQDVQESDLAVLTEVKEAVVKTHPGTTTAELMQRFEGQVKAEMQMAAQQKAQQEKMKNLLQPGTTPPEISLPNPDGQVMSLSALKGKVVLVDFWASWCKPCRMENPNVVNTYNKYKNDGFEIFSVSLDNNKQRWVQAIQQDNLTWNHHVSDLRGWQSSAAQAYNVTGIPFTVLLDKEGKVIATGLRGGALYKKLEEIFGY